MAQCPRCEGGGLETCPGRGCDNGTITCPKCNGDAKLEGGEDCGLCDAEGTAPCPYCTGSGYVKCTKCGGSGRVD
jgi:DnaJ-class molecular chaperone